jgi:aldehyde:ferredoxin oxidoreductase
MTPGFLGFEELAALTEAVLGIEMSPEKLWQVGERLTNIERLILLREGVTSQDDWLPRKSFEEPILRGPFKGKTMDPDKLRMQILQYYKEHDWDENGVPRTETMDRLHMSLETFDPPNLKNVAAR